MAPSTTAMIVLQDDPLVQSVTAYVKDYMNNYDASHSWDHIERVVAMAHYIYNSSDPSLRSTLDLRTIDLAALLHDVGDHKYLPANESPATQITTLLHSLACPADLATRIQTICSAVSYTAEKRDPAAVAALVQTHPELAVVQDADRLDAMGAVGIGRMFAYAGARSAGGGGAGGGGGGGGDGLAGCMRHLDEKLVRLEGLMKTDVGRRVAAVRGERLRVFRGWWVDEVGGGEG